MFLDNEDEDTNVVDDKEAADQEEEGGVIWTLSDDEEKAEDDVDVGILNEPSVPEKSNVRELTDDQWAAARELVCKYRSALPIARRLYE